MPELPEVEVVRRGLARWVQDATIEAVRVHHPRVVRTHPEGPEGFAAQLLGQSIDHVARRGKFCWFQFASQQALVIHLGMSGQMLMQPKDAQAERHLRVEIDLNEADHRQNRHLRFVDQRMFGGLQVQELVPTADGAPAGQGTPDAWIPLSAAHIARDALDEALDEPAVIRKARGKKTAVKRALLDQNLISGIGNIYADEALFRVGVHGERPCHSLSVGTWRDLLAAARDVMTDALAQGGTSFDSLYVDVNGSSGYFERSLQAYGRKGKPCRRCGSGIQRDKFMNRSSYFCPSCQKPPRARR